METRTETDSMGEVKVPADRYYGAQTQRSLTNFRIGGQRFSKTVIKSFGLVKKAAALANNELKLLDDKKKDFIIRAADEVIEGRWDDHFPLVIWQTGSGTQSNMNANEVIANRANELAGSPLGKKTPIHPNDDVNKSQSSNDVFPTVMHVAAVLDIKERLVPALRGLRSSLEKKAKEFASIIKVGRTHLMDATPLTLGQEFSGFAAQLQICEKRLEASLDLLSELALGGSAVGTGLNTHPQYADRVAAVIAQLTKHPFRSAPNKFASLAAHEAIVDASSATKLLATACMKIANDVRWLGSGPRAGLNELHLPENEPGSSIMPGKVNPTQSEAMIMVATRVMGNDVSIGFAGSQGNFELNVQKPLLIHCLLESTNLLADACDSFRENCVEGIQANPKVIQSYLDRSLMLVTALNPVIGYDNAAKVAKKALSEDISLKEAAAALNLLSPEDFDKHVNPKSMIAPHA